MDFADRHSISLPSIMRRALDSEIQNLFGFWAKLENLELWFNQISRCFFGPVFTLGTDLP